MRNVLIAAVLFASLLAFGCVGGQGAAPTPTASGTPAPGGQVSVVVTSPTAGAAITGKAYTELVNMGKSLECDLTVTTDSSKLSGKAYIKAKNVRIDGTNQAGGQTYPMTEVFKDEVVYTNVPAGMDQLLGGEKCDWLKFDPAKIPEQTQSVGAKLVETNTLDDKTKATFTCREAAVDDSKFAIASSCDMTEIIAKITRALTGGAPSSTPSGTPTPTGPTVDAATCAPFNGVPCSYVPSPNQALCAQCKAAGMAQ